MTTWDEKWKKAERTYRIIKAWQLGRWAFQNNCVIHQAVRTVSS